MARRARLNVPGGLFHFVSRFARDEWRLDVPGARQAYLARLGEAARAGGVEVLAYCLMSNHVHLVLVQGNQPLERFAKSLHTGFASWSRSHARGKRAQGPVFAARPRTMLVERDRYLLELVRYVHNNPVRAGVARVARKSTWSSHRAYVGKAEAPEWLRMGYVLRRFGRDVGRASVEFDRFVDEGRGEGRRSEFSGALDRGEAFAVRKRLGDGHRMSDGILGSDRFVRKVLEDAERVETALSSRKRETRAARSARPTAREVLDAAAAHLETDVRELELRPRSRRSAHVKRLALWTWIHEYDGRQIEMARTLQLDTGMASRHYGRASAMSGDYDEAASAVVARANRSARRELAASHRGPAGTGRLRYFVDVDET